MDLRSKMMLIPAVLVAFFGSATVLGEACAKAEIAVEVAAGGFNGCARYEKGAVWCWGPQVTTIKKPPFRAVKIEHLPEAVAISVSRLGACAIDRAGKIWCWGLNVQKSIRKNRPIISLMPFVVQGLPPAKEIDMGYHHTCALSYEHEVWCWGANPVGELGVGDTIDRAKPARVGGIGMTRSVAAGVNNTCATLQDGTVKCWGTDNPSRPGKPIIYETKKPRMIQLSEPVNFVSNGRNFSCGLTASRRVLCWGSNAFYQLGTAAPTILSNIAAMGYVNGVEEASDLDSSFFHSCVIAGGKVICWGHADFRSQWSGRRLGQLPYSIPSISNATSISTGRLFSCAATNGRVVCWGLEKDHEGTPIIEKMKALHAVSVPGLPD